MVKAVRRLLVPLVPVALALALPALALAGGQAKIDKPAGHDYTLDTIFVVSLSIPALLGFLTLIDIARGKHTQRHD